MSRIKYKAPAINYKGRRASIAIPDQSLSIQEIVKRYVRGIPVDVIKRQPVYNDQNDHDMEKLSRLDFGEKAELADQLANQAAKIQDDYTEAVRRTREERAEKDRLEKAAQKQAQQDQAAQNQGRTGPA